MKRAGGLQLTPISVSGQDFCVDIMSIREVITPLPVMRVPTAPAFVEGVIDLRGRVLPVLDLGLRLGLAASTASRTQRYVIATVAGWTAALRVDSVGEVLRVAPTAVLPAPELAVGVPAPAIFRGLVRHDGRALVVLDLTALFSSAEASALAGLPAGA